MCAHIPGVSGIRGYFAGNPILYLSAKAIPAWAWVYTDRCVCLDRIKNNVLDPSEDGSAGQEMNLGHCCVSHFSCPSIFHFSLADYSYYFYGCKKFEVTFESNTRGFNIHSCFITLTHVCETNFFSLVENVCNFETKY